MKNLKTLHFMLAVLTTGMFGGSQGALAATLGTTTFNTMATIDGSCNVNASDIAFGIYTASSSSDAESTITVACTMGTEVMVELNGGNANSFNPRMLQHPTATTQRLRYNLYTTSARDVIWGDIANSAPANIAIRTLTGTGLANETSLQVFGRVESGQTGTTTLGTYADTIGVTLNF